jgi:hypothetical protein
MKMSKKRDPEGEGFGILEDFGNYLATPRA